MSPVCTWTGGGDGLFRQAALTLAECSAQSRVPPVVHLIHGLVERRTQGVAELLCLYKGAAPRSWAPTPCRRQPDDVVMSPFGLEREPSDWVVALEMGFQALQRHTDLF